MEKDRDDTRKMLLVAALKLFAEKGYEGVSVRMIAGEVGANIAAIGYHFGGKEELYRATAEYVVSFARERIGPLRGHLSAMLARPDFDPRANRAEVREFISIFIESILNENVPEGAHALLMREYAHPGIGFEIFYQGIIEPMHKLNTKLYARIWNLREDDPAAVLGAHSMLGQWLCFRLAQQVLFRRLDWSAYGRAEIEQVKSVVVPAVMRSLGLEEG